MSILEVLELGEPVLRQKADRVLDIQDPKIQRLIDDMLETCLAVDGVGLAAPQVGQPLRIFVMASRPNPRYPHAPLMEPTAIINPVINSASYENEKDWEGCLSIPGLRGPVLRSKHISVSYMTRGGGLGVWRSRGILG